MKSIFLFILFSQASFAQSNSPCKNLWTIPLGWELKKTFESKTLCAYNIKNKKLGGSAQWIVSKYKNTSVYAGKLEDLGLVDSCIHNGPLNESMSCPDDSDKNYFKIIATKGKGETITEVEK